MSYKSVVAEIEEEYRQKRRRAEFEADRRRDRMIAKYPELDEADTRLRTAMRKYGFSQAEKADVERERSNFRKVLQSLGIDRKEMEPHYECPVCSDTGKTPSGRCNCFMQKLYSQLYREANLTDAEEQSFDTFDLSVFPDYIPQGYKSSQRQLMQGALAAAKQYAADFPQNAAENILLLGPAGVGKTFLANCICKAVLKKGHTVLATNAFGLFERLAEKLKGEEVDLNHIRQAELLFIDDLGMEPILNNFTIEYLFEILNERLKRCRNTIITSNLSAAELRERYTERIASRLFDRAHSSVIYLPGKDIRLIKR